MINYKTSSCTVTKDKHFAEILEVHIKICKSIMARYSWAGKTYHYFDLNAGPGIDLSFRQGSPVIFRELAKKHSLAYTARYFEQESDTANILRSWVNPHEVVEGDHYETFPDYFAYPQNTSFGLVYSDESGKIPPFDLLGECFSHPKFHRIDVLIYISSANVKRALKSSTSYHSKRLSDLMSLVNKKQWIVRLPQNKHQWTFLIGSNWTDFPAFERIGFYNVNSDKGREIMHRLDYTNEERKHGA